MGWLLRLLLDLRVERLQRDMLKHARRCCVGQQECPAWEAIGVQFDDALKRRAEASA